MSEDKQLLEITTDGDDLDYNYDCETIIEKYALVTKLREIANQIEKECNEESNQEEESEDE